jgi:hypothetical protein
MMRPARTLRLDLADQRREFGLKSRATIRATTPRSQHSRQPTSTWEPSRMAFPVPLQAGH